MENQKDLQLFVSKLIKKIPDPCNAKEHHQERKVKTKTYRKPKNY